MALIKKFTIWLLVFQVPFLFLAYQYLIRDSLAIYDASSHFAQVWYLKEYLWPDFSGFNPYNLLGFHQGLLYPSLFHYLAATLGFFTRLELAVKLLVSFFLIILPISCYLFCSLFFYEKKARAFLTGSLLVVLVALPGYLGANIKGLIQVGLLPSFVSLPLVLLYIWSIQKSRFNWILSTFFLSSVILTHLVAGLFSIAVLGVVLLTLFQSKKLNKNYFKHLIASIGLTSFFVVPFLFNYQLTSQSVHLASLLTPNILLFTILVVAAFFVFKFKVKKLIPLLIVALILNIVVLVDALVLSQSSSGFLFEKIYNLHLYRFQIYLYLISVVILAYWPTKFLFEIPRKSLLKREIILIMPLLVIVLATIVRQPFVASTVEANIVKDSSSKRFIETFSREDSYPFIYTSQNKLVIEKNKSWAYGLFTDSSQNGPYLGSLIKSFDPFLQKKEDETFLERKALDRGRIYDVLDLFAIDSLLFLEPGNIGDEKNINTRLLRSGVGSEIIETPKWEIENIEENWDEEVESWWLEKGKIQSLLVDNGENLKKATVSPTVKNLRNTKDWSNFSFEIDGEMKTPVLVKFTYLPGWVAKQNGEETKIYRVSPNLMLVNGVGEITFEYQKQWYQWASIIVSAFTFILLILLSLRNFLTKNAKS